jgi:hypothetical protein
MFDGARIEPLAEIPNAKDQPGIDSFEADLDVCFTRVLRDVSKCFLRNAV